MPPTEAQIVAYLVGLQTKDMLRRGIKVQAQARRLLGGAPGHPKRVDTGDLRSSVQVRLTSYAGAPAVRVGSNRRIARWIHDGTGIYGPRHERIYPRSAKALVFKSKIYGAKKGKFQGKVVVRSTKGMKPNRFLKDALPAAKD